MSSPGINARDDDQYRQGHKIRRPARPTKESGQGTPGPRKAETAKVASGRHGGLRTFEHLSEAHRTCFHVALDLHVAHLLSLYDGTATLSALALTGPLTRNGPHRASVQGVCTGLASVCGRTIAWGDGSGAEDWRVLILSHRDAAQQV